MNKLLIVIGILFAIGLALISLDYFLFSEVLLIISTIFLLLVLIWYIRFSNRDWKFRTTEHRGSWYTYPSKTYPKWRSQRPQLELMTYELYFCRKETIKRIHFEHGDNSETPKKWRMDFLDKTSAPIPIYGHRLPFIETKDPETKPNSNQILVNLRQPIQAYAVRVMVREPEIINGEVQFWTIQDINVRIKMPFGLGYTIGKCWLDRL